MRIKVPVVVFVLGFLAMAPVQSVRPNTLATDKELTWEHIENMQLSSDRSGVFFSVIRYYESASPKPEKWSLDLDSGRARVISHDSQALFAEVSPNGAKMVYSVPDPENPGSYLVRIVDLGSQKSEVIARRSNPSTEHWSSDGRWIAFSAATEGKERSYHVRIVDTQRLLADRFSMHPLSDEPSWVWHPAGGKLVYSTGQGRKARIIMLDVESQVETIIVEGHSIADFPSLTVAFSPDASQFFFLEYTRRWIFGPWKKRPRICSITEKTVRKPRAYP